ncbi:MAG: tRNA pseudouridine(38-40) synthase TruA [Verrucomicrobia bacterium RIFCSPLOWO2_12_FULL_64_8]|nr:MAG: tRNA pseudouridine(38-40) synthase TruA [Verrucomicrobia bacterium RIFCSPLOWO2_12_FULL_64_8]
MAEKLQRWKCACAYDGTGFNGWQSQPDGRSVQDVIERRLQWIFGRRVRIHGSGRTDAGVHALAQVFHFEADWPHGPEKLLAAFRGGLPPTLQVKSARTVPRTFHSRFSAKGKIYFYQLHHGGRADPFHHPFCWSLARPLDVAAMRAAAKKLVGRHDFRAFAADNGAEREDTVRHLRRLKVTGRGARLRITAEADGFLYKMMRGVVGALVAAGQGKLTPARVGALLRRARRTHAVQTAPAPGLFLARVIY